MLFNLQNACLPPIGHYNLDKIYLLILCFSVVEIMNKGKKHAVINGWIMYGFSFLFIYLFVMVVSVVQGNVEVLV